MDSIDRYGNRRQQVEWLASAWKEGSGVAIEPVGESDDPLIAAVGRLNSGFCYVSLSMF